MPGSLEISPGDTVTIPVKHINSAYPIANTIAINLRQAAGEELAFVNLVESTGLTDVTIDATDLQEGDQFTLQLQSFDTNQTFRHKFARENHVTRYQVDRAKTNE